MANKYFVWKDPNCNGEDIEWIEMDNIQFSAFIVLPENKFRRFIRLGNQICHTKHTSRIGGIHCEIF